MALQFFSIGVYGTTEESFFEKLTQNKINIFCDIRNRRGVRGSHYSYANSNKLQEKLGERGITYLYVPGLAPTNEIRNIQNAVDKKEGISIRQRDQLSDKFREEFEKRILSKFNFKDFLKLLEKQDAKRVVLFCVEADHQACHRSLIMQKLHDDFNYTITHL
jgi:uncharacterized protein (DUF488 family)